MSISVTDVMIATLKPSGVRRVYGLRPIRSTGSPIRCGVTARLSGSTSATKRRRRSPPSASPCARAVPTGALGVDARSRALLSAGDDDERLYRAAIDRLGRIRGRVDSRAHFLCGEWLSRDGRRKDAREQLRLADGMFTDMGMEAFADRTRKELLATGEKLRKLTVETATI